MDTFISVISVVVLLMCAAAMAVLQRRLDAEVRLLRSLVVRISRPPVDLSVLEARSVTALVSRTDTPTP